MPGPQSRPAGIIVFAHVVRSFVRPHFLKSSTQNKQKTMFATGETVGLAEWIIDETCLVEINFERFCSGNAKILCDRFQQMTDPPDLW